MGRGTRGEQLSVGCQLGVSDWRDLSYRTQVGGRRMSVPAPEQRLSYTKDSPGPEFLLHGTPAPLHPMATLLPATPDLWVLCAMEHIRALCCAFFLFNMK